jgi:hypothetical protein
LPDGRIYPLTRTRRPEKGLPDNKITRYFSKTQKAGWAVQICELYWTQPQSGKITRTPMLLEDTNGLAALAANRDEKVSHSWRKNEAKKFSISHNFW